MRVNVPKRPQRHLFDAGSCPPLPSRFSPSLSGGEAGGRDELSGVGEGGCALSRFHGAPLESYKAVGLE
jgi:hypothetical protein